MARPALWLALLPALAGCSEVLGYGDERERVYELLDYQSAESSSGPGRCDGETPALAANDAVDCDAVDAPLAGTQSILVSNSGAVGCSSCWSPRGQIWAEFLARFAESTNFAALAFEPSDISEGVKFEGRATGASVFWSQGGLGLVCAAEGGTSDPTPVEPGQVVRVGYYFNWPASIGSIWVADANDARAALFDAPPVAEISCAPQRLASTGWLARGNVKPDPGSGTFVIDEIRVAESREGLLKGELP
jgi:hypothetical protein